MTQGLKLASEQAEGYLKIMAIKEAIQVINSVKPSEYQFSISHRSACKILCFWKKKKWKYYARSHLSSIITFVSVVQTSCST
jgi:hypothetical protein